MTYRVRVITTLLLLLFPSGYSGQSVHASSRTASSDPVVVPFDLVLRHILIKVSINNSAPLWFIFDTGDKVAIVDLDRAKSLGLNLEGEVNVGGAGAGTLKGARVRDASLTVLGVDSRQPVVMAIPLDGLKPKLGHEIDGIIGADFIKQFVIEIDYPARVLRFHDRDKFAYSGSGEIVPITLNGAGHPIIRAEVTVNGRPPIGGQFVVDVGSGGSLILNRPFVEQESLLSAQKTIKSLGGGGAGGKTTGRSGRVAELKIGKIQIASPLTMFSEDQGGAFATSNLQGNIGQLILSKFTIFLDYPRSRIILEPNSSFKDLIGPASPGVRFVAEGADYKTLRVDEMLEDSPAANAGLQAGDVVVAVDERPAADLTLSILHDILEKPAEHKVSIRRGGQTLQIRLTPRRLI
jgi:aspartyl protease/PDZ domain-containing protein